MLDHIFGLPAHPLIIHAAVVFVPLFAVVAIAYAVLPPLRRRLGWLLIGLAVVAPATVYVARLSGLRLRSRLNRDGLLTPQLAAKVSVHLDHGTKLLYIVCALTVVALLLMALEGARRRVGRSAVSRGGGPGAAAVAQPPPAARGRLVLLVVLAAGTIVLGVAAGWYVYKTGDSGARMIWSGI